MPMYWTGPFICKCECGWTSESKKNPIAAQYAGEAHSGVCPFYRDAMRVLHGEKKEPMPDRSAYFQGGNFLKAADVRDGQFVIIEKFEEAKTRIGTRPVLRLKGIEQPLGLNATNFDKLVEKFGDDEKKWQGKKVKLEIVDAPNPSNGGKVGPAIRIK